MYEEEEKLVFKTVTIKQERKEINGMKKNQITGIAAIIIGFLLLFLKGKVISILLTVIGILVLVSAFMDWRSQKTNGAMIKAIVGICILAFGWLFINLALCIVAAILAGVGIKKILAIRESSPVNLTLQDKAFLYGKPALMVFAGVILFFNLGGVIDWVFIVVGVLLIVEGFLEVLEMKR